jgi:hypothetical protein
MAAQEFTTNELCLEEWRDIPKYEGYYQASSLGRVRSLKDRGRGKAGAILSPGINRLGYHFLLLSKASKKRCIFVHRLVLAAFVGERVIGTEVNHIDSNKANNRPQNLEYVTHRQNMAHAVRNNLMPAGDRHWSKTHPERVLRGEQNAQAKLTDDNVLDIRCRLAYGVKGVVLAREYSVSDMLISKIKRREIWKHLV